jgi:hypothetical protein
LRKSTEFFDLVRTEGTGVMEGRASLLFRSADAQTDVVDGFADEALF